MARDLLREWADDVALCVNYTYNEAPTERLRYAATLAIDLNAAPHQVENLLILRLLVGWVLYDTSDPDIPLNATRLAAHQAAFRLATAFAKAEGHLR
jgi:hypothetical protein